MIEFVSHKLCKCCFVEKRLSDFHLDKNGAFGRKSRCTECISKQGKNKRLSSHIPPSDLPNEVWRDIHGFEGLFSISNKGRVKSMHHSYLKNGKIRTKFEKILTQKINDYYVVNVTHKSKSRTITVHRELAKCFIPNPDNKPCVNHIDGNKLNNSIENLEWVTYKENTIHGIQNGLIKVSGDNCHWAKLSQVEVIEIYKSKESAKLLSEKYSVNTKTIYSIRKKRNWRQVINSII